MEYESVYIHRRSLTLSLSICVLLYINILLNINAILIMMWPYKWSSSAYSERVLHNGKQINKPIKIVLELVSVFGVQPKSLFHLHTFFSFSITIYNLYFIRCQSPVWYSILCSVCNGSRVWDPFFINISSKFN